MQTDIDPRDLIGHKAVDRNGDKIGTVDEVYLDDATGRPEWAAVRTGVFGRDAFVPLNASEFSGDQLRVPYEKSLIKDSPDFGAGQHLSPAQEMQLYRYYGLDAPGGRAPQSAAQPAPDRDFGAVPAAGPAQDQAQSQSQSQAQAQAQAPAAAQEARPHQEAQAAQAAESRRTEETAARARLASEDQSASAHRPSTVEHIHAAPRFTEPGPAQTSAARQESSATPRPGPSHLDVVCREERVEVTTEWHVLGTARLRKYVVTEEVERRIPVVRERVRIERVPVTEAELAGLSDEDITEAVEEVTLREERPVVRKRMVPIERVRLVVERVTHEEVVRTQLRREQVKVHDGGATGRTDLGGSPDSPHVVQFNGSGPSSHLEQPIA
ncbi:DUF2382 domain-containing protein [Peterkaempfera bronchialis]|uniref:DUF2382 domain-containing protein n=1 Tax=Peterkaempfera bronchialis TaxID=2126346 RepID=UPI003C300D21